MGSFKKSLLLRPDRQSDCKCSKIIKMFTFSYPTSWRPEHLMRLTLR